MGDQELGMGNTVFVMRSLEGQKKGRQKGTLGQEKISKGWEGLKWLHHQGKSHEFYRLKMPPGRQENSNSRSTDQKKLLRLQKKGTA